jgi:hypothetical protein
MRTRTHQLSIRDEANEILSWFQENYDRFTQYSNFKINVNRNGNKISVDPVFDVVFRGVIVENICKNFNDFHDELFMGIAQLRGHLSSIKRLKEKDNFEEVPLNRLLTIFSRFHLVANQLKRRRKTKTPYLIEDEYDVQNLLLALLRIDFDDIRKEDWAPIYAGGASRIDFVLKSEGILIEVKKKQAKILERNKLENNSWLILRNTKNIRTFPH